MPDRIESNMKGQQRLVVSNKNFRTNKRRNFSFCGGQTIKEGEACLVYDELGRSELHLGPKRMWRRGAHTFQFIPKKVASSTEYLALTDHQGRKNHKMGPCYEWFNPVVYKSIEVCNVVQVQNKEAIVVYNEDTDAVVSRDIVYGPRTFVPKANEWIGQFSWHGPTAENKARHKAGHARLQKLSLTPTNMAVEIKDARSSDDCTITVNMIMFHQLVDVNQMLNTTQDPVGDLISAMCADVISMVAENTFENFVEQSPLLNKMTTFPELSKRAPAIGFHVIKVVYMGYAGNATMQRMHDNSITTRTRQKLNLEKRQQEMLLAEYTLGKKKVLDEKRRKLAALRQDHSLAILEMADASRRAEDDAKQQLARDHMRAMHEEKSRKLDLLKEQGVDLTKYVVATQRNETIRAHVMV